MRTKTLKRLFESELKQLNEAEEVSVEYGFEEDLVDFAKKVTDFINNTIDEIDELRDEGSELLHKDITMGAKSVSKATERNSYIMDRLGLLKRLRGSLIGAYELLKRRI